MNQKSLKDIKKELVEIGYNFSDFTITNIGDYHPDDSDWNYKDIQHVEVNKQLDTPTKEKKVPGVHEIKSPFVGTFYRSSSPESDPYITVGKKIKEGKVLCIIEAMKIMNEIESEISGEIIEICVENENYVEFGQTLFKVKV